MKRNTHNLKYKALISDMVSWENVWWDRCKSSHSPCSMIRLRVVTAIFPQWRAECAASAPNPPFTFHLPVAGRWARQSWTRLVHSSAHKGHLVNEQLSGQTMPCSCRWMWTWSWMWMWMWRWMGRWKWKCGGEDAESRAEGCWEAQMPGACQLEWSCLSVHQSCCPPVLLSSCTVVLLLYALSSCTFFHPQVHPAQAGLRLSACGICCRPRKN